MGYGTNAVQQKGDLTEALEHLANAALSDQAALTNLTQANLTLVKQLEKAQEEIEAFKKKEKKELNNVNNFTADMHQSVLCEAKDRPQERGNADKYDGREHET
eukprot:14473187-Ditylum_brightwellii.AAC.1